MIKKFITIALFIGAIFILLSLSYWQVKRLQWKQNIIEHLDTQYQQDPVPIATFDMLQDLNTQELPLLYGQITGRFFFDKEVLWGPKTLNGKIGYNIITPLQLTSGEYVLVHRGWVENKTHQTQELNRAITITGIFRKPEWNRFTPNNNPAENIWTKPDIAEISQIKNLEPTAPVLLYAHEMSKNDDAVTLNQDKWYPRNKHKQYAIFWFVMALVFIGVFGLYRRKSCKTKLTLAKSDLTF